MSSQFSSLFPQARFWTDDVIPKMMEMMTLVVVMADDDDIEDCGDFNNYGDYE